MGVARAYFTGSPYNGAELAELSYAQTTDTLYLAHIDHQQAKLTRSAHTDWLHENVTFGPSISPPTGVSATPTIGNSTTSGDDYDPQPATYVVTSVNDETGEESRASAADTATNDLSLKNNHNDISWSAATDATRYNVYKADNDLFYGFIGTTENTTFRDLNIAPQQDIAPPRAENPFNSANDRPSVVALFEQRLLWARTRNTPNGIWGSRIGAAQLENMDRARPAQPDDAFSMAIVSEQANPVNQLLSSTSLVALTQNGLFRIDGDGSGGVILANQSPSARREVGRGSSRLRPITADNVAFYAPSTGYAVRTIGYSFDVDGLKSNDVSIFSPHFFSGFQIVDWAYAQEPLSIIWAVRSDGKLLAFTWEQEQGVWGWTLCETDGLFQSVCVITENGEDRLYAIIEREINGVTKRFVERMASQLWETPDDAVFVDCAVSGEFVTAKNTFTGLAHLEGRDDIAVNADGTYYTGLTVTNGALSLPNGHEANKVSIGIGYQVDVHTLPVRAELPGRGSNIGRDNQSDTVSLVVEKTGPFLVGPNADKLVQAKQRLSNYGGAFNLFDGVTDEITLRPAEGREAEVHIRQTDPAPLTILNIVTEALLGN